MNKITARCVLALLASSTVIALALVNVHPKNRLIWGGHSITLLELILQALLLILASIAAIGTFAFVVRKLIGAASAR